MSPVTYGHPIGNCYEYQASNDDVRPLTQLLLGFGSGYDGNDDTKYAAARTY